MKMHVTRPSLLKNDRPVPAWMKKGIKREKEKKRKREKWKC